MPSADAAVTARARRANEALWGAADMVGLLQAGGRRPDRGGDPALRRRAWERPDEEPFGWKEEVVNGTFADLSGRMSDRRVKRIGQSPHPRSGAPAVTSTAIRVTNRRDSRHVPVRHALM
ncbi:hypothetical protein GCM10023113_21890 [Cellulomonas oligotrophica]|uniref:Uncharacterized protein n=1 Tax=Cellulomonas oligotrophica TaxID=931536 RepID=A0ABQ4DEC4_9CELL|nr:hypothetical protein Col01nite_32350 [Cellulomonas oligotrophica]